MLDPHVRNVLFYEFVLVHEPLPQRTVPLADVLLHLRDRVLKGESRKLSTDTTEQISISDIRIDEKTSSAFLLFNYGNSRLTDPAFLHLDAGTIRIAGKEPREGIAVSAHMALSFDQPRRNEFRYRALIEDVPGIGKTKIIPFLTAEIKLSTSYSFKDENGAEKSLRIYPDLRLHQSQQLRDVLAGGGVITAVELVRYNGDAGFDEEGVLKEERASLVLKIERNEDQSLMAKTLARIRGRGAEQGYTEMRLVWKQQSQVGRERQRSARIGLGREDAMDAVFGRQTEIKLTEAQPQCRSDLSEEVCSNLLGLLRSQDF